MEVDKITKEYAKKITNRIQTYKELIIESFVEFYGENYKKIIIDRFNDISFLYYINDVTIFYIVDSLKQGHEEKLKNIIFIMPYIVYLIENNLYRQELTPDNFYKLGMNKIIGFSDKKLLLDEKLVDYSIAIALRENNESPYECNLPTDKSFKRVIALPIFCVDDKDLFHEINHAISSEIVIKNDKPIIKCGFDYGNEEKEYYNEILNDMIALEVYNIFKKKCTENILEDNIMKDVFHVKYTDYHYLISKFYEKNKNSIKLSYIDSNTPQLDKQDFEYLSNLFKSHRTK